MAGYKDFERDEVFTSSDLNDYLMLQSVMVFDTEPARSSQLAGILRPGLTTYIKETKRVEVFTGSGWLALAEYSTLPSINVEDELSRLLAMDSFDDEVRDAVIGESFLFYSIFNNYVDDNWTSQIWR